MLFGLHFGAAAVLPAFCILGAALVALSWIDLREHRLPREITYTAFVLGAIALTVAALVDDEPQRIWTMLFGAGLALAIMGAIYLVSRGGMGDGDVRLSPLLGLYLGWLNPGDRAGRAVLRLPARRRGRRGDDGRRQGRQARRRCRSDRSSPPARWWPCSSASGSSTCCGIADQSRPARS